MDWIPELDEVLDDLAEKPATWLTVEKAAYVAIGLLAAVLRFFQLGLRPLSEAEAVQALAAFRFSQGAAQTAPVGTIPGLFTGNVVGFGLLGAGDMTARWLPALAGVILVLLPYGLRGRLGRGGALAASLLLALSPSAVFFSRSVEGASLVAVCGLAAVVGLINYIDTRRTNFLYLAAAALGLGLTAGTGIYTLLLIAAAFVLVLYLAAQVWGREAGWAALRAAWGTACEEKGLLAKTGAVLAAAFGLAATTLILHPAGVGQAADLLAAWATNFLPGQSEQPVIYPWLLLLRYEALILVLGLVEVGRWLAVGRWRRAETSADGLAFPFTAFLVFWAVAALALLPISGHREAGNVLLIVAPLALLAAQGASRAWRWITVRDLWTEAGLFAAVALILGAFFYLQLAALGLTSSGATVEVGGITLYATTSYLLLSAVALLLLIGLAAIAWFWRGPSLIVAGGWLALIIALALFGFKEAWTLNVSHAGDARELMRGQTTAPEVRQLAAHLKALSLEKAGDFYTLPVTVAADTGPVVAWYLRGFDNLTIVEDLSAPPQTVAAVTLAAQDLPIGETFRGQGYPLRTRWSPWGLWSQSLVRWLLFSEGERPIVDQEVVLWVAGNR